MTSMASCGNKTVGDAWILSTSSGDTQRAHRYDRNEFKSCRGTGSGDPFSEVRGRETRAQLGPAHNWVRGRETTALLVLSLMGTDFINQECHELR
jgi:hypothetical protein